MTSKIWGGRFKKELHPLAKEASYSLVVDQVLFPYDIEASLAHAQMLARKRIISAREARQLARGLKSVLKQFAGKDLTPFATQYEDVHTFIQLQLEKKVGGVAKAIHTARSRNDLVITATTLYLRKKVGDILDAIAEFQKSLVKLADQNQNVAIPGYTHLQRAQVVSLAHHLLAYVEMLERDRSRLVDSLKRLDTLPLGAGALAGTSLPIHREFLARKLGFSKVSANSIDAVSDRDSLIEVLADLAILWMHLSRLSEDVILWSSSEFGFVALSDEWSTGSSLMPHKKNPDLLELARGWTGRIFGNLQSLLVTMKGLPLAYNRDLQLDKMALVESVEWTLLTLDVLSGVVGNLKVNREKCAQAASDSFLYATDLLEYLVQKGLVFRQAHERVGKIVSYCLEKGLDLADVPLDALQRFSKRIGEEVYELFSPTVSLSNKRSSGSPAPKQVQQSIRKWKTKLGIR